MPHALATSLSLPANIKVILVDSITQKKNLAISINHEAPHWAIFSNLLLLPASQAQILPILAPQTAIIP
jgi:hypothetical protein